jgi:hypothetical protein
MERLDDRERRWQVFHEDAESRRLQPFEKRKQHGLFPDQ